MVTLAVQPRAVCMMWAQLMAVLEYTTTSCECESSTPASCDRPRGRCELCMGDGLSTGTRAFRQRTRGFMARVAPRLHETERGGVKTRDRDASVER